MQRLCQRVLWLLVGLSTVFKVETVDRTPQSISISWRQNHTIKAYAHGGAQKLLIKGYFGNDDTNSGTVASP